jgi:hypothetical protein
MEGVINYGVHTGQTRKVMDFIFPICSFTAKKKKTGIEQAFEDIEKGRVTFVNGPKKNQ